MDPRDPRPASAPPPPPARPRKRHPVLRAVGWTLGGLVLILLLLVVFLPSIASTSPGKRAILGILEKRWGVPVEARELKVSWTGQSRLEELRIGEPQEFTGEEDMLRVKSALLRPGLLGLLFSRSKPVVIEIDEPVAHLHRNHEGRFNIEALASLEEKPGKEKRREENPRPKKEEGPPRITREVSFSLQSGRLDYQDDMLGAASRLSDLTARMNVEEDTARLEGQGKVGQAAGGAPPGTVAMDCSARGLSTSRSVRDLQVNGQATVDNVDLRPYRGLVEKMFGMVVPDQPVSGKFQMETKEGLLQATSSLDLGAGKVTQASLEVPLEPGGRPASLKVPFSVDLAGAQALLGSHSGLPQGTALKGKTEGSLQVSGPLSVDDLKARGAAALKGLSLGADATTRDFQLSMPGEEGRPETIAQKELALVLRAAVGDTPQDLRIESATVKSEALNGTLSGSLSAPKGGADEGRPVQLTASMDAALPPLVKLLAARLKGVEVGPSARAKVSDLKVEGRIGGKGSWAQELQGGGRLELAGGVKYPGLAVEGARGELRLKGGELSVLNAEAGVNGGHLTAPELAMGLGGQKAAPFRMDLKADGVDANYDLTRLLAYVVPFLAMGEEKADFSGKITANLSIKGAGTSLEELEKTLTGKGGLKVADGKVDASRFFNEAARVLGGNLKTVLFSDLGSDFDIGGGRINARKVFLNGKQGSPVKSLGLKGTTYLDGRIDYGVEMSAVEEAIGDQRIRSILGSVGSALGQDVLPLKLGGTLSSPQLALNLNLKPSLNPNPSVPSPDRSPVPLPKLPGLPDLKPLRN